MLTPIIDSGIKAVFGAVGTGEARKPLLLRLLSQCPAVTCEQENGQDVVRMRTPHQLMRSAVLETMLAAWSDWNKAERSLMSDRLKERLVSLRHRYADRMKVGAVINRLRKRSIAIAPDGLAFYPDRMEPDLAAIVLCEIYQCLRPADALDVAWVHDVGGKVGAGHTIDAIEASSLANARAVAEKLAVDPAEIGLLMPDKFSVRLGVRDADAALTAHTLQQCLAACKGVTLDRERDRIHVADWREDLSVIYFDMAGDRAVNLIWKHRDQILHKEEDGAWFDLGYFKTLANDPQLIAASRIPVEWLLPLLLLTIYHYMDRAMLPEVWVSRLSGAPSAIISAWPIVPAWSVGGIEVLLSRWQAFTGLRHIEVMPL